MMDDHLTKKANLNPIMNNSNNHNINNNGSSTNINWIDFESKF